MMKEDEFPGFMIIYRQLRKEGIEFPQNNPSLYQILAENVRNEPPKFDFVLDQSEEKHDKDVN